MFLKSVWKLPSYHGNAQEAWNKYLKSAIDCQKTATQVKVDEESWVSLEPQICDKIVLEVFEGAEGLLLLVLNNCKSKTFDILSSSFL
jgi:hypothetical protein